MIFLGDDPFVAAWPSFRAAPVARNGDSANYATSISDSSRSSRESEAEDSHPSTLILGNSGLPADRPLFITSGVGNPRGDGPYNIRRVGRDVDIVSLQRVVHRARSYLLMIEPRVIYRPLHSIGFMMTAHLISGAELRANRWPSNSIPCLKTLRWNRYCRDCPTLLVFSEELRGRRGRIFLR